MDLLYRQRGIHHTLVGQGLRKDPSQLLLSIRMAFQICLCGAHCQAPSEYSTSNEAFYFLSQDPEDDDEVSL